MSNDKSETIEISNLKLVLTALVLVLGSNAGSIYSTTNGDRWRPDPYTGLEAAQQEARILNIIQGKHEILDRKVNRIEWQIDQCMRKHK